MKKVLIVVDYQVDFVVGSLGFTRAKEIESNIVNKIKKYRRDLLDVIFTLDTHDENYLMTEEGKHLPVVHCQKNTLGWQLYGEVASLCQKEELIFQKNSFGSKDLFSYLEAKNYDEVELIGLVSNICVLSNAILAKTALPNSIITVDSSCCASNDTGLEEQAFSVMKGLHILVKK